MQELAAARQALDRARLGLQERDFLVVAHERSEAALAGHARELTAKLQGACADVSALSHRYCLAACVWCNMCAVQQI